jgi:hypothetical protein
VSAQSGRSEPEEPARTDAPRRFGLLLASIVASVALQGIGGSGAAAQVLVSALAGASLFLAFRAAGFGRRLLVAAAVFGLIVLGLSIARASAGGIGDGVTRATNAGLVALGPPAVAVGVLKDLRSTAQVELASVMGVLSFYLLVGMTFSFVYGAIDHLGGHPFFADGQTATVSHCLYFSFMTLTTVGFGDLAARSDLSHTLCVFEALIGQIYLVTVVSVLVSNLRPGNRGQAQGS